MWRSILGLVGLLPMAAVCSAQHRLTVHGNWADYGNGLGSRHVIGVDYQQRRDALTWHFGLTRGERLFVADKAQETQWAAGLGYRWGARLETHALLRWGGGGAVLPRWSLHPSLSYRFGTAHAATLGFVHVQHAGNVASRGVQASLALRQGAWGLRLRHVLYQQRGAFSGRSHASSVKLQRYDAKGQGSTALEIAAGNRLAEDSGLRVPRRGHQRSVTLHRSQPLGDRWVLRAALGQVRNEVGTHRYSTTTVAVSVGYRW